jgi:hypothetical protein
MSDDPGEMRELIAASKRYLAGAAGLAELHGYIGQCEQSPSVQNSPALAESISLLRKLLEKTWNEWGISPNPLPRREFDEWLQMQVAAWEENR